MRAFAGGCLLIVPRGGASICLFLNVTAGVLVNIFVAICFFFGRTARPCRARGESYVLRDSASSLFSRSFASPPRTTVILLWCWYDSIYLSGSTNQHRSRLRRVMNSPVSCNLGTCVCLPVPENGSCGLKLEGHCACINERAIPRLRPSSSEKTNGPRLFVQLFV